MSRFLDALTAASPEPHPYIRYGPGGGSTATVTPCGWCFEPGIGTGHLDPATGSYTCAEAETRRD